MREPQVAAVPARSEASPYALGSSARGSSFYAAMRLLPREQRAAVFEIYRFCRSVDDIADGDGSREARLAELARWRADVDALFAGAPPARLQGLLEPIRRFDLQRDDFLAVIDGMEMDASDDIRAPDLAALDLYCDRVACAVGRLCVRVFGLRSGQGVTLASSLGRALQLTNILRDLDEDAGKGRLYLPRELLVAAGIGEVEPRAVLEHAALGSACAAVARLANDYFAAAEAVMAGEPRAAVRAPRLMATVYERVLDRLNARGWAPPRHPVRLGRSSLLWIALRHAAHRAVSP